MKLIKSVPRIAILLIIAAFMGCSNGGEDRAPDSLPKAPAESSQPPLGIPPIVDHEDSSSGFGEDADKNGIRDDIDQLISKKYSKTSAEKKAAEQQARAIQGILRASTRAESVAAGNALARANACVYKTFPRSTPEEKERRRMLSIEIEALTANTRERFNKYWAAEKMAGNAVYSLPPEPVCD